MKTAWWSALAGAALENGASGRAFGYMALTDAAERDMMNRTNEMNTTNEVDAVALQMCRSAGLDDDTAVALIWRIKGWVQNTAVAQQPVSGADEVMKSPALWRSMDMDPPKKTGRYCVGHRGNVFGDAYYTARVNDTHYPVGWSQVPRWRPSHWLDVQHIGDAQPQPTGNAPIAVLRFDRKTPGNENEMPSVVSCRWLPDGEHSVYLQPSGNAGELREALQVLYDAIDSCADLTPEVMKKARAALAQNHGEKHDKQD